MHKHVVCAVLLDKSISLLSIKPLNSPLQSARPQCRRCRSATLHNLLYSLHLWLSTPDANRRSGCGPARGPGRRNRHYGPTLAARSGLRRRPFRHSRGPHFSACQLDGAEELLVQIADALPCHALSCLSAARQPLDAHERVVGPPLAPVQHLPGLRVNHLGAQHA